MQKQKRDEQQQPDPGKCLNVCVLGDKDVGISTFLRRYKDDVLGLERSPHVENFATILEFDNQKFRLRLLDNLRASQFAGLRATALRCAQAVVLCFAVNDPTTLENLEQVWLPALRGAACEAPYFVVGLRTDLRGDEGCISEGQGAEFATEQGAVAYFECSSTDDVQTVRELIDEVVVAAKDYYLNQWRLEYNAEAVEWTPPASPAAQGEPAWLVHERINLSEDVQPLTTEAVSKHLSVLGYTSTGRHAYLRSEICDLGLTSIDAVRPYQHLQSVSVARNKLRTLEPLGALRGLLHLNASFNLLLRTQTFTAPDALETIDLSYNLISELGDWSVHKYLRELNLRGNFIDQLGPGLQANGELRVLDLSENNLACIENMEGLDLRTLHLAQNRLSNLDGVFPLSKLQALNVRHNNITTVAALRSSELPRLRKLYLDFNRISRIQEIESLQSFATLQDLTLEQNFVIQLPHYRQQVLHRLPRLRFLDGSPAQIDEKVKADIIYAADVETRKGIFEGFLPQEEFIDRRLITENSIADEEKRLFGKLGDAAPV